jgi:hypothetical protein
MIAGIDLTDPGDLALLFICLPLELGVLAFLLFWMIQHKGDTTDE